MRLTSSAFAYGSHVPVRFTCDSEDVSPPLAWTDPPPSSQSFALICSDPDAPGGTWYHWAIYDIPQTIRSLDEHLKAGDPGMRVGGANMTTPMPAESQPTVRAAQASGWEHFAHDADIGVRGWGPTPACAFAQAAQALTCIVTDAEVRPLHRIEVSCEASDLQLLLVEWLNTIIYEMAVQRMLFGRFEVEMDGVRHLRGTLWGEPVDVSRHAPAVEPKGATCTALRVSCEAHGRWNAACVIDV